MKVLSELFSIKSDIKIYSIHSDSRYVKPYSIFFCIEGFHVDGHQYIADAIFQGAKCIVHSKNLEEYQEGIAYIKVKDTVGELNRVANIFYDYPSHKMKMIGITGTSGKTIVASLVKNAVSTFCKTGYIGTISLEYNGHVLQSPHTTPETLFLQRNLNNMQKCGVKVVAMEASSHGLYLRRVEGIRFNIAVMTNIGADHLDFHGTREHYIQSQLQLFALLDSQGTGIVNLDDPVSDRFVQATRNRIITYGIDTEAQVMAKDISLYLRKTRFTILLKGQLYPIVVPMIGYCNVYNCLALACVLLALGSDEKMIVDCLQNIQPVSGRMELLSHNQPFHIIVDYCQTVDHFKTIYSFIHQVKEPYSRVIAVLGAPGRRKNKDRQSIGQLTNQYCDYVILTELDDRGEETEDICLMMQEFLVDTKSVIITNRQIAIEQAIVSANKDDIILLLGKGHEKFISLGVGNAKYPGDKQVALSAIEQIYNSQEDDILETL